jgi:hypothetical protein
VNFVAFPSGGEAYYEVGLSVLNLVGIEGVTGGVQNLLYREVFDFQAGDELHIRDYNTSFGEGQESRTIIQYLTRTDFPDSIVYSVQVARDYYDTELGGNLVHTGFLSEVQSQVIKASPSFDQLSMSPAIGQFGDANYYVQSNASQREKSISGWYELYLDGNNCWYAEIDGGCSSFDPAPSVYIEKRGGPYYHCGSNFISSGRELVYFNVDGQEGGTPFQLILNAEAAVENEFRVYPNPAIDKVSIEIGEAIPNARIEISDIQGRIVLAERLTGSRSEIEVGTLPAGVFIYRIYADEAVMTTGKILVQR